MEIVFVQGRQRGEEGRRRKERGKEDRQASRYEGLQTGRRIDRRRMESKVE